MNYFSMQVVMLYYKLSESKSLRWLKTFYWEGHFNRKKSQHFKILQSVSDSESLSVWIGSKLFVLSCVLIDHNFNVRVFLCACAHMLLFNHCTFKHRSFLITNIVLKNLIRLFRTRVISIFYLVSDNFVITRVDCIKKLLLMKNANVFLTQSLNTVTLNADVGVIIIIKRKIPSTSK